MGRGRSRSPTPRSLGKDCGRPATFCASARSRSNWMTCRGQGQDKVKLGDFLTIVFTIHNSHLQFPFGSVQAFNYRFDFYFNLKVTHVAFRFYMEFILKNWPY